MSDGFDGLWARSGLASLAAASTVRATLSARTLAAALDGTLRADAALDGTLRADGVLDRTLRADLATEATTPLALAPEVSATLPTLPTLDLVADRGAVDAELTVVGLLGEGGMGRVLVARQRSLAREVAVKVGKPGAPHDAAFALLAEARIMGHLEHPSVVPVHALGRDAGGSPVIVMKRIEGVPWSALLADAAHPAWSKLATLSKDRRTAHLEILVSVCNAVGFAHRRGIVHRDLKPDNVMVGEFGEVYVTDWGIALVLASVSPADPPRPLVVGTPAYLAPEMVLGDPRRIDPRTDVFLLGAIVHEILTGRHRHDGDTLRDVMRAAFDPVPYAYGTDVPEELAALANRATSARPEDRHPDVLSFQKALVEHLHHLGSIALCDAALGAFRALEDALATPPEKRSAEASSEVERLGSECRFGFHQALRSWPDNVAAQQGQRACVTALVRDRLRRGDAHGARALISELDVSPADLRSELDDLEASLAESAREHRELVEKARDLDPAVAAHARTRFLAVGLVVTVGLVALIMGTGTDDAAFAVRKIVLVPLVLLALAVGGLLAQGRSLATTFNRRTVMIVIVSLATVVLHRLVAARAGEELGSVLRGDALILAGVFFAAGAMAQWVMVLAALPMVAVAALLPSGGRAQMMTFGAGIALSSLVAMVGSWVASKKK